MYLNYLRDCRSTPVITTRGLMMQKAPRASSAISSRAGLRLRRR
nr:MAG TPA: hypothetical protein [Caudoviricetes sp.]